MRKLDEINDESDIYQPVSAADFETAELALSFVFPDDYRQFVATHDINVIKKLPSLLWFVDHSSLGIVDLNLQLQQREYQPYPEHLIAFATNECGDYFCFDRETKRIVYIDPDYGIEENLADNSPTYDSFDQWVKHYLTRRSNGISIDS